MTLADIYGNYKKDRSREEIQAALIAFDALQGVQKNTEILFAYLISECRKINPCVMLPLDREKCIELGLPRDDSYAMMVAAIDAYVREFRLMHGSQEEE